MMKKYTTIAIPVDVAQDFQKMFSDISLSFVVRTTLNNCMRLAKKSDDPFGVVQQFMFGGIN